MDDLNLYQTEITTAEGEKIRLVYDQEGDTLDIFFGKNEPATGIDLTDNIVLRFNQKTGRAISLTILHFSILAEQTEYGPRSYSLDNLGKLPEELRELVLRAVTTAPVNQFLKVSHFQASPTKRVPVAFVESHHFTQIN